MIDFENQTLPKTLVVSFLKQIRKVKTFELLDFSQKKMCPKIEESRLL